MTRPLALAAAILVWAIGSVLLVYRLPIWIGALYVIVCALGAAWWLRRDSQRRIEERAASLDTRRAEDQEVRHTPSGRGFGRHSWGAPTDDRSG